MTIPNSFHHIRVAIFLLCLISLSPVETGHAKKPTEKESFVMTELVLQAEMMSFADRFASYMYQALRNYENETGITERRKIVQRDVIVSVASAMTIAADLYPTGALLDMVAMVTMGRMIYHEHWVQKYGNEMLPLVEGYQKGEAEIWNLAEKIIDKPQQKALKNLIRHWREKNPKQTGFAYLRFGYLAVDLQELSPSDAKKAGGLFKSVQQATQKVEETRLMAERAIFLASRMPLLAGGMADMWMSDLVKNPDVKGILSDFHNLSETAKQLPVSIAAERQAAVKHTMDEIDTWSRATIDQMMKRIALERQQTIKQFFNELQAERQNTIQDLMAENQKIHSLVAEIRETLKEGNQMLLSGNLLADKFAVDQPADTADRSKPFDIEDYRKTAAEVSNTARELGLLVEATNKLVETVGLEQSLPHLLKTIEQIESESEELVDHTFKQIVLLILIWFVGYIAARLAYDYITRNIMQSKGSN